LRRRVATIMSSRDRPVKTRWRRTSSQSRARRSRSSFRQACRLADTVGITSTGGSWFTQVVWSRQVLNEEPPDLWNTPLPLSCAYGATLLRPSQDAEASLMPEITKSVGKGGSNTNHAVPLVEALPRLVKNAKNVPYYAGTGEGSYGMGLETAITPSQTDKTLIAPPTPPGKFPP